MENAKNHGIFHMLGETPPHNFYGPKRKLKEKNENGVFSFAFGSMLKVLDSYFVKQREIAMDGNLSSNGERIRLCYDASLMHCLTIGILVLFHADIRKRKYTVLVFSFHYMK